MRYETAASDDHAGEFAIAKQSVDRITGDSAQEISGFGDGIQCAVFHSTPTC